MEFQRSSHQLYSQSSGCCSITVVSYGHVIMISNILSASHNKVIWEARRKSEAPPTLTAAWNNFWLIKIVMRATWEKCCFHRMQEYQRHWKECTNLVEREWQIRKTVPRIISLFSQAYTFTDRKISSLFLRTLVKPG